MRAASYCDVTLIYYSDTVSMDAFIITMALSARAIQHGAHRHDCRGIYRCVLLRFRGRIEIDHSYGLRCRGSCCHSRHSTRGPAASGRATAGPLMLCQEWQHKPLQRRPYRGQFLYHFILIFGDNFLEDNTHSYAGWDFHHSSTYLKLAVS